MVEQNSDWQSYILETFMFYEKEPKSYTRHYYWWKKQHNLVNLINKQLRKNPRPIRVLEVGCGTGGLLFSLHCLYAEDHGFIFYGLDLDLMKLFFCQAKKERFSLQRMNLAASDVNRLPFTEDSFDLIICSEVMEHLKEPQVAMREFWRVLKPAGIAFITTPNESSLFLKWISLFKTLFPFLRSRHSQPEHPNLPPVGYGHINVWRMKDWQKAFLRQGLRTEKVLRGAIAYGGTFWDNRRLSFTLCLGLEIILDHLPILRNLSEDVCLVLRKQVLKR